jgi:hypothetical protein
LAELLVQIDRGEIPVDVTRKKIKNLYIRVDRNDGRVRISAPRWMNDQELQTAVRKHYGNTYVGSSADNRSSHWHLSVKSPDCDPET